MEFSISPTTGVPIYQQLAAQIRAGVARGKARPNERLPSVRELSQALVVNPNTVARAYTELEREGVLYTRQGLGVFINGERQNLTKRARRERLLGRLDELLTDAVWLGFAADEIMELTAERIKQFEWSPSGERGA